MIVKEHKCIFYKEKYDEVNFEYIEEDKPTGKGVIIGDTIRNSSYCFLVVGESGECLIIPHHRVLIEDVNIQ